MKDVRLGESLWIQWHGNGYISDSGSELIYYTLDHVDIENEIVRRALASTLQRDGICDSLSDGFNIIEKASIEHGYSGIIEGETEYSVCNDDSETEYGDLVEEPLPTTWVEI